VRGVWIVIKSEFLKLMKPGGILIDVGKGNINKKAIDYANSAIKISEKIAFKEGLSNANIEKKKKYLSHFLQPNLYKN
jgi:hypothetical protein